MQLAEVLVIDICTYDFTPRAMVYPTESAPVIVREGGQTTLRSMRWGFVPHWADDEKMGAKLINARSETAAQKPAFREAWKSRRCLVPATGFYEWNRGEDGKQPYLFAMSDRPLFCIAGLWERWERPPARQGDLFGNFSEGPEEVDSFTILTRAPNAEVAPFHDRMPVLLEDPNGWLDRVPDQAPPFNGRLSVTAV